MHSSRMSGEFDFNHIREKSDYKRLIQKKHEITQSSKMNSQFIDYEPQTFIVFQLFQPSNIKCFLSRIISPFSSICENLLLKLYENLYFFRHIRIYFCRWVNLWLSRLEVHFSFLAAFWCQDSSKDCHYNIYNMNHI